MFLLSRTLKNLSHLSHRMVEINEKYTMDWLKKYKGNPSAIYEPHSTSEVQQIVAHCNENNIGIVPQGGNTGLVGGAVPINGEIVINLSKLNRIYKIDTVASTALVDAGVVLEQLDIESAKLDLMVPLDLGAKGSCHIGGNIATNAGGLRYLRYGSLFQNVLALEVVLANGTVLPMSSGMKKDNTGYHLKNLFVGSEGTLGIITKALVQLVQKPKSTQVSVLAVNSYKDVVRVFQQAKKHLSEILSAYEFWDSGCMKLVDTHLNCRQPFSQIYPFYILIETHGSNAKHDSEKLSQFLELMMESIVVDGTLAQSQTELLDLWKIREGIPEAANAHGRVYKYDVSLPLNDLYGLVDETRKRMQCTSNTILESVGYGHMGDGNLHLNVCAESFNRENQNVLEPFIYEYVQKHSGSVSAEHGIGQMKRNALHYSKSIENVNLMKQIKNLVDPKNIMNPGKMF
eukprot:NODE_176_length_14102_cov_0.889595.p2 type:complete len:458 gc:universal NODE_176_length_14102_cov_0.889595:4608-3235(-)